MQHTNLGNQFAMARIINDITSTIGKVEVHPKVRRKANHHDNTAFVIFIILIVN